VAGLFGVRVTGPLLGHARGFSERLTELGYTRPAPEAKNGRPMVSNDSRSAGSARNTSSGTGLPAAPSRAIGKQNDLRRMSNDCAQPSTRTVTSGSARHLARR
jgi:hypothetical protein